MLRIKTKTHKAYFKQTLISKTEIFLLMTPGIIGCQAEKEKSVGFTLMPVSTATVIQKDFSQYKNYTGSLKSKK